MPSFMLGDAAQLTSVAEGWLSPSKPLVLHPFFHPIESLVSGEIVGLEALVRFRDKDVIIMPSDFLPHLSRQQLMDLFFRMLSEAHGCLNALYPRELYISINIETFTLTAEGFLNRFDATLEKLGYKGRGLVLEILEGDQVTDVNVMRNVLDRVKACGVEIALDDIGSAYSSLLNLRDLPIDIMKLDKSFARGLVERPDDLRYISSLLSLSRGLKKRLVVEGVETDDVKNAIRVLGVEYAQGYVIAKPMPADEIEPWLRNRALDTFGTTAPSTLGSCAEAILKSDGDSASLNRAIGDRPDHRTDSTRLPIEDDFIPIVSTSQSLLPSGKPKSHANDACSNDIIIPEHLGIALIDDDIVFRIYLAALIGKNSAFVVFEGSTGKDLHHLLETQCVDCIILDYNLGTDSGFAVREKLLQTFEHLPPILMLTSDERQSTVIKALRIGIQDYLPKHKLKAEAVLSSVSRIVRADRERRQNDAEHRRLLVANITDPLTGLSNRWCLDERVAQIASLPAAALSSYAIIFIEMLAWKDIAERVGFEVANRALRAFGDRVRLATRANDICGRYLDGTFLAILNLRLAPVDLDAFCQVTAQRLSFQLDVNEATLSIRPCIGVARCGRREQLSLDVLISHATQALLEAKSSCVTHKIWTSPSNVVATVPDEAPLSSAVEPFLPRLKNAREGDRRLERRQKVFRQGRIYAKDRTIIVDCTVKNLSSRGAGLRIDAVMFLPSEFWLEIVGLTAKRSVRLRWQAGLNLGVEYDEAQI